MILNDYVPHSQHLTSNDLIFVLLPLRHTCIPEHVFYATQCAFKYLENKPYSETIKKFIKAAFKRVIHENNHILINIYNNFPEPFIEDSIENFDHILDKNAIPVADLPLDINSDMFKNKNIIVSLSGGVDSMVCLHLMKNLPNVYAVHINYMNRKETIDEEKFVVQWCKQNNVLCFTRRINEIKRNQCMQHGLRETYEDYTRKIRFSLYKYASDYINNGLDTIVVLGHNKDDAFENIINNLKTRSKYDNLEGMDIQSNIHGVNIIRPLKDITKNDIFAYAAKYNIPFLKNTTPEWSSRAIIRNNIQHVFTHHGLMDGIFDIGTTLKNTNNIIDFFVNKHINEIDTNTNSITCSLDHPLVTDILYASKFFKTVYQNKKKISRKSIENFINKAKTLKQYDIQYVILNTNTKIRIKNKINKLNIYL